MIDDLLGTCRSRPCKLETNKRLDWVKNKKYGKLLEEYTTYGKYVNVNEFLKFFLTKESTNRIG